MSTARGVLLDRRTRRLREAYLARPQDPAIVAAAARLAGETVPPW